MLALLGGSASVSLAGCSALFGDGDDDDGEDDDNSSNDGSSGLGEGPEDYATHADKAQAAWERVTENTSPEDDDLRNEAYVEMEEAARDAAVIHPMRHDLTRAYWYDYVDVPKVGVLGRRYMQHTETTTERDDNEFREQINTFTTIDPITSTDVYSGRVIAQMYDKLVNFRNGEQEIENVLIEGYESSDDGTTWTFELKQGVEFHDGTELTAEDVVYSIRRVAESPNSLVASFVTDLPVGLGIEHETGEELPVAPESTEISAVDDYTVEFTTSAPHPDPLEILTYGAFHIMPAGLVDDVEGYDGEYSQDEISTSVAVGSGPFVLESFTQNEDVELTAFGNYHGSGPELDSIYYLIVEEAEAIWTNVIEQNVDLFPVPTNQYDPVQETVDETDDLGRDVGTYEIEENGQTVNYLGIEQLSISYYAFNVSNVPEAVRKAVGYVIDREEIIDSFFKGIHTPAYSFTPPAIWPTGDDGYEDFQDEYPYGATETDIDSAEEVLEEGGYTPDDPFELTISTADDPTTQAVAENIQAKLSGTGVDVSVEPTQFSTLIEQGMDGSLDMYGIGWSWSWPSPAYGLYPLEPKNTDTSGMPGANNGYYLDWQENLEDEA